ncbi:MAG: chloride channel protein [Micavibrio sp.]|nr:chloride channel protein [Micavibrio sp.]
MTPDTPIPQNFSPSRFTRAGRWLRDSQPAQIIICVFLGVIVAAITVGLHNLVMFLHAAAYGLTVPGEHLSGATVINHSRIIYMPALGGLALGLLLYVFKRWKPRDIIDPIEANAVFGGRMSFTDSLRLLAATLISNGAGGSIGMEAAYTQMGGSITSALGAKLKLRREDMRIFVAAGAAAAISAAFNAPLAGAFYGYELVLGMYKISALAQVTLAALAGNLFLHAIHAGDPIFSLPQATGAVAAFDYAMFACVGIASAFIGILTMQSVTGCEAAFKKLPGPEWLRPVLGGGLLTSLALLFPQVLGSGQGGIDQHLHNSWPLLALYGLLAAKIAGSAISIGSGFRGGLFSAALFIGCLTGQIAGLLAGQYFPDSAGQVENFMLVGIGSVAASVIGAPVTMVLLVLEMTGNFPATGGVMAGVLVSSTITRYTFGYSFSTWRFHLRGLRILGAHDVGWVNEHTVRDLMFSGTRTLPAESTLGDLRQKIPAGSLKRIFLTGKNNAYEGVVDIAEAHSQPANDETLARPVLLLAKGRDFFLLPNQNIRAALDVFAAAQQEELPVIASAANPKIIGHASETHVLKRYAQALEKHEAEQQGL